MGRIITLLARSDPTLAKRLLGELEDADLRANAARSFISNSVWNNPRDTLRWAQSFAYEDDRPALVIQTFGMWVVSSPREATRELLAMRDGELRDQIAASIGWSIARRGHVELAEEIFDATESEIARKQVAAALLQHYTETDPDEDKAAFYRSIAPEPTGGRGNRIRRGW